MWWSCRERDTLRGGGERLQSQVAGVEMKERMSMEDIEKLTKEVCWPPLCSGHPCVKATLVFRPPLCSGHPW